MNALVGDVVHGCSNRQKVLEELERDIFIRRIGEREFQGDSHHIQAKHAHPTGTVTLLQVATGGQRSAAVKYANVVQAQKAALKDVLALRVLAIDPPGEIEEQLVEDALQEHAIRIASLLPVDFVNLPRRPGDNWWIDIVK